MAYKRLDNMELGRSKSNNLNGVISGCMKDRIICLRTLIRSFMERLKDSGDVTYLRRRNNELSSQLRESRKEETSLKNRLKVTEEKIKELGAELAGFRAGSDSRSLPVGLGRSARSKSGSSTPFAVAPRAPTSSGDMNRPLTSKDDRSFRGMTNQRASSVMESLQDCEGQLNAMAMYEDRISRFEELLTQIRCNLYGSMEALSDKIGKTTAVVDHPKRGAPRIISDI